MSEPEKKNVLLLAWFLRENFSHLIIVKDFSFRFCRCAVFFFLYILNEACTSGSFSTSNLIKFFPVFSFYSRKFFDTCIKLSTSHVHKLMMLICSDYKWTSWNDDEICVACWINFPYFIAVNDPPFLLLLLFDISHTTTHSTFVLLLSTAQKNIFSLFNPHHSWQRAANSNKLSLWTLR